MRFFNRRLKGLRLAMRFFNRRLNGLKGLRLAMRIALNVFYKKWEALCLNPFNLHNLRLGTGVGWKT